MTPLLADAVLVVHCLFVVFVVAGLLAIWTGAACGWRWVRNYWFRVIHLAAIGFVALEALSGMACPLTVWEDALRGTSDDMGLIARWIRRLLFYNFPEWVFTCTYVLFALTVAATWRRVRPHRSRSK